MYAALRGTKKDSSDTADAKPWIPPGGGSGRRRAAAGLLSMLTEASVTDRTLASCTRREHELAGASSRSTLCTSGDLALLH